MSDLIITNGTIVLEDGLIEDGEIRISGASIVQIGKAGQMVRGADSQVIDAQGRMVCPGLIDLHTNGAVGYDFLDANESQLAQIAEFQAIHGTTTFLATLCTAGQQQTVQACKTIRKFVSQEVSGATLGGIHLEGPYFNLDYRRVHPAEYIRIYTRQEIDEADEASGCLVKLVTLAPELPHALEFIDHLLQRHTVAAIGHTAASYEEAKAGIEVGITYATHLFCAMRGIHHREPGASGAALMDERVTVEVLSDGLHLHPEIVRLVYAVKGSDLIVLATDAMAGTGLPDGEYRLAGRPVIVKAGKTISSEGRIAGGLATMNAVVRNARDWLGIPVYTAVKMGSLNPAKVIGSDSRKGSLKAGKDADIFLCDTNINVFMTIVQGDIVFCADAN